MSDTQNAVPDERSSGNVSTPEAIPSPQRKPSGKMIHDLMAKSALEIGVIAKSSRNEHFSFNYRGIDDVYNHCHKVIFENGITVKTKVLNRVRESLGTNSRGNVTFGWVVDVKVTFVAPDGSKVSSYMCGEAQDSGDKGLSKAVSMAMKYVFFTTFLIPTNELDSDGDKPEELRPLGAKETKAKQPNVTQRNQPGVTPAEPGNSKAEKVAKDANDASSKKLADRESALAATRGKPLSDDEINKAKTAIAGMQIGGIDKIVNAIVRNLTNDNITKAIASEWSVMFFNRLIELTDAKELGKVVYARVNEFASRGMLSDSDKASVIESIEKKASVIQGE